MTAHALKGDKERCLAAGMDAYVSKPIREAELLAAVERWNDEPASSDTQGASAMSSDQPPFDLSEALARVRNRRPLLRSMAEIFIGQSDDLLDQCEAAIESADGPTLERAAHTLKSSAASFCAATVSEIAQRLECRSRFREGCGNHDDVAVRCRVLCRDGLRTDFLRAGRTAEFGNAKADFQVLKSEMGRLLPALKRFLDEPDPPA
ncbi:MAG: Hpt domain-containing protein [Methylocaldum sp.]|nr:Hpt domain-containing protein [Methylocaldum sp.]